MWRNVGEIKDICKSAAITIHKRSEDLAGTEIEELSYQVSWQTFHSHGEDGVICGVDGNKVKVERILSGFRKNPTMAGKPDLFFIQASE